MLLHPFTRRCLFLLVLLSGTLVSCLKAQEVTGTAVHSEWQWSGVIRDSREHVGSARAFLWIPPDCRFVRSVIVAQNNMEEASILENPRFRKAMAELGFAEIWVSPSFDHLFRFNEGAGEVFDRMMDTLASLSGYEELKWTPIVPMGHSAAASWPYYFAAWNPKRTLAALSVSGQWPYFRNPDFAPDIWGDRNIDYIPCLETMGEYEAASTWADEGLKERQQHPAMPLSMLASPAQGHFAATDAKVDYLALYIRKAAAYRLPAKRVWPGPPILRPIDPRHSGWLVDRWRLNRPPSAPAAPVGKYTGDPAQAFWFFDRELALATEKYEAAWRDKKAPLLAYLQDGTIVSQHNTHQQVDLAFRPGPDGISFRLEMTFLDTVPGESARPSAWTGLPAGSPVPHPDHTEKIRIHPISGPFRETGPNTFRLIGEKGVDPTAARYELWFAAVYPGDSLFKPAVQQAKMVIPARNITGAAQHIGFPSISDQLAGNDPVQLHAISDAGLPVSYYVLEGPAFIDNDSLLRFTKLPPRSRLPVRVTVVAWQWGRQGDGAVRTAEPVSRTFFIHTKRQQ